MTSRAPVVFLHGVTRCSRTFAPLLPAILSRRDAHLFDHRGHWGSSRRGGGYRVADYIPDAVEFVREMDSPRVIVYGHSLGAMVAAAVAGEIPGKVQAVILEDPPFHTMGHRIGQGYWLSYFCALQKCAGSPLPVPALARELAELRYGPAERPDEFRLGDQRDSASLRFTAACLKALDPAVLDPICEGRWLDGYDRDAILARLQCPVLLLQADPECGGMLIDEDADAVTRLTQDCARVSISKAGHLLHGLATEHTARIATSFLESL